MPFRENLHSLCNVSLQIEGSRRDVTSASRPTRGGVYERTTFLPSGSAQCNDRKPSDLPQAKAATLAWSGQLPLHIRAIKLSEYFCRVCIRARDLFREASSDLL